MKALRYRGFVLALAAAMVLAVGAWANVWLLNFWGFDYWWPADCYNAVGYVPSADPTYLTFDYATNEYTFAVLNACVVNIDSTSVPDWKIVTISGGTFDFYCDPIATGTMADFGVNPPNGTSPSTFTDGDLVLGGDFNQLVIYWDTITGWAQLDGVMDINRGSQLGNIPPDQRTGWTLAALRQVPEAIPIPEGYFWQIDGQLYIDDPIPVERTTWGQLKRQFRGGE